MSAKVWAQLFLYIHISFSQIGNVLVGEICVHSV